MPTLSQKFAGVSQRAEKHGGKVALGTVLAAIPALVIFLNSFDMNISDLTKIGETIEIVAEQQASIDSLRHITENQRRAIKAQRHQSLQLIEILSRENVNVLTMADLFSLQTPDSLRAQ